MPVPPRVLLGHTYYRQRGGEDVTFEAERGLLREFGHDVSELVRDNADLPDEGVLARAGVTKRTLWAGDARREVASLLARSRPDVAHFHNTFPQLSPSVFHACAAYGVPVVQTLHNYRVGCVAATLFRDGRPCEDCVGRRVPWHGVVHACYHDSRPQSAVVTVAAGSHRIASRWIDRYVATSEFARGRFVAMGLDPARVVVKPHSVHPDPGPRPPDADGGYLLFVGRLSPEKGLHTLFEAAARAPHVPLLVAGDGPLRHELSRRAADDLPHVEVLGQQSPTSVAELMGGARAVVVPSEWYEPFGLVVIEAFARGTPVICNRIGALSELVDEHETGLLTEPWDPDSLAGAMRFAAVSRPEMTAMGVRARQRYEQRYTAEANYKALRRIYGDVIG